MARVLIIGAGGVGNVVVRKCASIPTIFEHICLASRTLSKCDDIAKSLDRPIETAQLDADDPKNTVALINKFKPDLVLNIALP
ncbi:MAG: saccharopine dehydrogenase NADP-binding domain-containing protein, partial [Sedimentisphaerales bacterium]|nr:saccharopine dehydrogenase NADP-binding domain-containing protein [Sedimentisphaerales bacterium]